MSPRHRDLCGGLLTFLAGCAAATQGATYGIGNLAALGAGFFPTVIGALLMLCGLAMLVQGGISAPAAHHAVRPSLPDMRGATCIILSLMTFEILARYSGLLLATFLTVTVAALGDRTNRPRDILILATVLSILAGVIFWGALKVQLPLFYA